jgi:hypothetical protein
VSELERLALRQLFTSNNAIINENQKGYFTLLEEKIKPSFEQVSLE